MIVVEIRGGLGNQLFQFALGYALARKKKTTLLLDISHYSVNQLREFHLDKLGLGEYVANDEDIQAFKRKLDRSTLRNRLTRKVLPYYKLKEVREQQYHFDPNIFKAGKNIYLKGFWQSEKYFTDCRQELLEVVKFPEELRVKFHNKIEEIEFNHAAGLHIRRGDYAENSLVRKLHGLLPAEYYLRAVEQFRKEIPSGKIFIFTDDPQWVRDQINFKNAEIISSFISADPVEDLFLYSRCKHNITANSTFSWWGAWLNRNPDKIVICPDKWFDGYSEKYDTRDLIPERWIKV